MLCTKHGASVEEFKTLIARNSADAITRRLVVTVGDRLGRCYVDEYVGIPASTSRSQIIWAAFGQSGERFVAAEMWRRNLAS